jgi:hypothetical protein
MNEQLRLENVVNGLSGDTREFGDLCLGDAGSVGVEDSLDHVEASCGLHTLGSGALATRNDESLARGHSVTDLCELDGADHIGLGGLLEPFALSMRKGKMVKCVTCGEEFWVRASGIGRRKYCSVDCLNANRPKRKDAEHWKRVSDRFSRERRGANNPAYKNGRSGNRARCTAFSLKLKGEECCRVCGSRDQLHLHHAIPRSMYLAGRDELLNGIPLCNSCHMSWHRRGKVVVYRDHFTDEEWAWLSAVELQGFNMTTWLDERYPIRITGERQTA